MKDLKIRVADEAESKEAQELFFELGAKWRSQINREEAAYVLNTEYPFIILHGGDMSLNWNTIEQFNSLFYYKEITLQELRDMVNPMKEYLEKQADDSYKLVMRGIVGKDDDIEVPEGADVAVYPHFSKGISFFKNNFRFAFADSSGEWEETDYCPENLKHWKSWRVAWQRHAQPEELPFIDDGITDCREAIQEIYKPTDFGASSLNDQYAEIEQVHQGGMKFDSDKPRYSLLPKGVVNSVVEVLEFGAKKYSADNWREVDNAEERYYNAAMRHIDSWWNGEKRDPETGIHHLAHAATNLFFLMWFDNK